MSGRRDSNPRSSAPKTGQTTYCSLLKSGEHNCFRLNGMARISRPILNSVHSGALTAAKLTTAHGTQRIPQGKHVEINTQLTVMISSSENHPAFTTLVFIFAVSPV
jgi:hypothetical protein